MTSLLLALCLSASLPACSTGDGSGGPGKLPLSQLRSAPDTLAFGGHDLVLRTFIWRDFQPVSPPNGKPLIAIFWVYSADSTALPAKLTADAAWVVHGQEIWNTYLTAEEPPPGEQEPYQLEMVAREGPPWGPGIEVDAVVRLRDGTGKTYLIRASRQPILRTD
ncbi:MAG: hypothetical protein SGI90_14350 [Candidatus Eisenbacteria bacterium]|nr:hypothetical protein [Candidatus Eisenbacteria bacterium]